MRIVRIKATARGHKQEGIIMRAWCNARIPKFLPCEIVGRAAADPNRFDWAMRYDSTLPPLLHRKRLHQPRQRHPLPPPNTAHAAAEADGPTCPRPHQPRPRSTGQAGDAPPLPQSGSRQPPRARLSYASDTPKNKCRTSTTFHPLHRADR